MGEKYTPAGHADRVLKASRSRCSARAVLLEACRRAEFDRPETTFTKDQMQRSLGYSRRTIQLALQFLRAEGTLDPIRHFEGGKGHAVTYRLKVIGQGGKSAQPEAGAGDARGDEPAEFTQLKARFQIISPNEYQNWIARLQFVQLAGGVLTLKAPTVFIANYVTKHLGDRLTEIAANLPGEIERVKVQA